MVENNCLQIPNDKAEDYLLWIDATAIYGNDFQISQLLSIAKLRKRSIATFSRFFTNNADNNKYILLESSSSCPRILPAETLQSSATLLGAYCILDRSDREEIIDSLLSKDSQRIIGAISANEWHGLEMSSSWEAGDWYQKEQKESSAVLKLALSKSELPERFRRADLWHYDMQRKEHPVYKTSYSAIGHKVPSQHDLVTVYHGIKGGLQGIATGKKKVTGLKTMMQVSKVHDSLNGW